MCLGLFFVLHCIRYKTQKLQAAAIKPSSGALPLFVTFVILSFALVDPLCGLASYYTGRAILQATRIRIFLLQIYFVLLRAPLDFAAFGTGSLLIAAAILRCMY